MMAAESSWKRQHLRVPRTNRSLFERPPLVEAGNVLERNRSLFEEANPNLQGRTLRRLRDWTRQTILEAARAYTSELRGEPVDSITDSSLPLIVGGHQPALFHPGVWAKNFAVGGLAHRAVGTALHLIVDNDTLPGTRLILPAGTREQPILETIAIDADRPAQPWEEARVLDRPLFNSFAGRAARALKPWGFEPLASSVWNDAQEGAERTGTLAGAFTTVRHRLERRWGLSNLELPFSRLCTLDPFLWFAGHILAQLPRFRAVHNTVLQEYRHVNRIRSRTHPVADLRETDGWLEAPFWVWREGDRVRGRVFAKQSGRHVLLSDGKQEFARLKLAPDMEACCAVEDLRKLAGEGIRFRTRALTTTLFARLCLADVFVHGIGGAKYDEMTDRLFSRFYGITAPEFLTVSATVRLPIGPSFNVTGDDEHRLVGLLRDLRWNADRHITPALDSTADTLVSERKTLAEAERRDHATPIEAGTRRRRHRDRATRFHRFQELSRELSAYTAGQRDQAEAELHTLRGQRAANGVLNNREYSFVLFPEEKLRPFLQGLK